MLTEVHDVVPADGTVVDDNIPGPEGNSVPLQRRLLASEADWPEKRPHPTFLTSNRFFSALLSAAAPFFLLTGPAAAAAGASVMSMSAMVKYSGSYRVVKCCDVC